MVFSAGTKVRTAELCQSPAIDDSQFLEYRAPNRRGVVLGVVSEGKNFRLDLRFVIHRCPPDRMLIAVYNVAELKLIQ